MLEELEATRKRIQAQFLNRLTHPMMQLSEEQKASMGIELTLGAGYALSEIGHPLGPVLLKDASAMSEAYAASRMEKTPIN